MQQQLAIWYQSGRMESRRNKSAKSGFLDQRTIHHIVNPHFFKQANYYVASSSKQVDQWARIFGERRNSEEVKNYQS